MLIKTEIAGYDFEIEYHSLAALFISLPFLGEMYARRQYYVIHKSPFIYSWKEEDSRTVVLWWGRLELILSPWREVKACNDRLEAERLEAEAKLRVVEAALDA